MSTFSGRLGGEVETYAVPARSVLGLDGLDVADPVAVPSPESAGVVDANGVNAGYC